MEKTVNEALKRLKHIQQAELPDGLYAKIQHRIKGPRTISMNWVRIAAAVIVLLMATEFYWVSQYTEKIQSSELEALLPSIDNGLYYE